MNKGAAFRALHEREGAFIIPNPWDAVETCASALKAGGMLCAYSPNMNQAERTCSQLAASGFVDVRTIEMLERELVVRNGKTRPSYEMLGHTGYLTFARKIVK